MYICIYNIYEQELIEESRANKVATRDAYLLPRPTNGGCLLVLSDYYHRRCINSRTTDCSLIKLRYRI